ncbi:hypothetical protein CW703_02250 [Candidatus Bathyarchaeota archaeon]|nr:MAG: hypothetical protein CW703_02250 [Candidatus Bathyarchaeota archaeon]
MSIKKLLNSPSLLILNFLYHMEAVRHKDLARLITSRGTLSLTLNSLLEEGLISRHVNTETTPIQTYYAITEKGKKVTEKLEEIKILLEEA